MRRTTLGGGCAHGARESTPRAIKPHMWGVILPICFGLIICLRSGNLPALSCAHEAPPLLKCIGRSFLGSLSRAAPVSSRRKAAAAAAAATAAAAAEATAAAVAAERWRLGVSPRRHHDVVRERRERSRRGVRRRQHDGRRRLHAALPDRERLRLSDGGTRLHAQRRLRRREAHPARGVRRRQQEPGDGCSGDCSMVETGWQCRVPGKLCVPLCGDGMIDGHGDLRRRQHRQHGRLLEHLSDRAGRQLHQGDGGETQRSAPSPCAGTAWWARARRATAEPTRRSSRPAAPARTVSSTATGPAARRPAPRSRPAAAPTVPATRTPARRAAGTATSRRARTATTATRRRRRLLADCQVETGFTCTTVATTDTDPLRQTGDSGKCLELPVKYRDFKNESVSAAATRTSLYLGATWSASNPRAVSISGVQGQTGPISYTKRYCVPNSAGRRSRTTRSRACWDIAQANLDDNGRPAFNTGRTGCNGVATLADCQFTDSATTGTATTSPATARDRQRPDLLPDVPQRRHRPPDVPRSARRS